MYPAFRSARSTAGFCLLIALLLLLPVILYWTGLPSREEAYKSIPVRFGVPGNEIRTIYDDPENPDVVFLGSSLVMTAIFREPIEHALSSHLGRTAHVAVLAMTWQGLDLQYYLLRDFLERHNTKLIVLNLPQPGMTADEPHPEAYRWLRYGESQSDLAGLSIGRRVQLYGFMVLGEGRSLLSRLRPNLIAEDETTQASFDEYLSNRRDGGYQGAPFVAENDALIPPRPQASLLPLNSSMLEDAGPEPGPYPAYFLGKILDLAKAHNCKLVFLHIPIDSEYGMTRIPELTEWSRQGAAGFQMIGIPSATLFPEMSKEQFLHFYVDVHFNKNGSRVFTNSIIQPIVEAYDDSEHSFPTAR
jgi:hypothetical protein